MPHFLLDGVGLQFDFRYLHRSHFYWQHFAIVIILKTHSDEFF